MEVIRWLLQGTARADAGEACFFIHTHNSLAGLLMVLQMRASGYRAEFRPFGMDVARLLPHDENESVPRRRNDPGGHGNAARPPAAPIAPRRSEAVDRAFETALERVASAKK